MSNPWDIDEERIPEDERARAQKRRLRRLGLVFWGLFIGGVTVLLAADTGSLSRIELVSLVALAVATALVAAGVAALLVVLLGRFSILGKLVFGLVGLVVFFVVLPALVSVVLDRLAVFEEIATEGKQPFVEFVRSLLPGE